MGEPVKAEIILYQSEGANVPVQVRYMNETLWMPQREIADLFGTSKQTISYHMGNIFGDGELDKESVVKEILTTASDGKNYRVMFYNLDAIIAVGYRVNSMQATRFRQWATATLKEYIVKGFVLNDDMLKNGAPFGKDYFDELLVRIRDIRASSQEDGERRSQAYEARSAHSRPRSDPKHHEKRQGKLTPHHHKGARVPRLQAVRADDDRRCRGEYRFECRAGLERP